MRDVNFAEYTPNGAFDSFTYSVREDYLCILLIRGVALYIITPSSLKKKDNSVVSVGSVGSVGKSEKSPENSPRKVFQNAYIAYTTYTDIDLELHHWLYAVPLHPAGGARLIDVSDFV